MSRGLDAATQTALAQRTVRFAHLLSVETDTGTVYITDAFHDLTHLSNTYGATGSLLQFGTIKETAVLQVGKIDISLTGINSTVVTTALADNLVNKRVLIYRAIIEADTGNYISTPRQIFDGNISSFSIKSSATASTISISAANHFANFMQLNGRITNTTSQQAYFENDRGFEFSSSLIRDIKWGQE
jgi:hypothetical protein